MKRPEQSAIRSLLREAYPDRSDLELEQAEANLLRLIAVLFRIDNRLATEERNRKGRT